MFDRHSRTDWHRYCAVAWEKKTPNRVQDYKSGVVPFPLKNPLSLEAAMSLDFATANAMPWPDFNEPRKRTKVGVSTRSSPCKSSGAVRGTRKEVLRLQNLGAYGLDCSDASVTSEEEEGEEEAATTRECCISPSFPFCLLFSLSSFHSSYAFLCVLFPVSLIAWLACFSEETQVRQEC